MNTKSKDPCEKYGIAITDYVLGEQMDMTMDELFNHLRQCAKCRADIFDWQKTYAALCTRAHFSKPETQRRMAEMINRLKKEFLPPKVKSVITIEAIGEGAGKVWRCLGENGEIELPELPGKCDLGAYLAVLSTGWLAKEEKIEIDHSKPVPVVKLTPKEQNLYMEKTGKLGQI